MYGARMCAGSLGQRGRRFRAVRHEVGDPEFSRHRDGLPDVGTSGHVQECH